MGSGEFQNKRMVQSPNNVEMTLCEDVAWSVSQYWNAELNCGLVMGANYAGQLSDVREKITRPDKPVIPLFIPGIARNGDPEENIMHAVLNGQDSGGRGFVIVAGSSVVQASQGPDCGVAAKRKVELYNGFVNKHRKKR